MKPKNIFLIFLIFFVLSFPDTAKADIGPKPTLTITVDEENGKFEYYFTILSKYEQIGPWRVSENYDDASDFGKISDSQKDRDIFYTFSNFEDEDGYYFLNFKGSSELSNTFEWSYYRPKEFKILMYYPAFDKYFESEEITAYAFDSFYDIKIENLEEKLHSEEKIESIDEIHPDFIKSQNINTIILAIKRIFLTITIELIVAFIFKMRSRKALKTVLKANIITQIYLNIIIMIVDYFFGELSVLFLLIPLEIIIVINEALIYKKNLKREEMGILGPNMFSFVANLISFFIGEYVIYI